MKGQTSLRIQAQLMFWERNHFGSPWGLFSLFRLTHVLLGRQGRTVPWSTAERPRWLASQAVGHAMFPVQITDRHDGIHSPESKFADKGNKSLCNVTERQTPFFISPCISHWSNNISTRCMQKENVEENSLWGMWCHQTEQQIKWKHSCHIHPPLRC